MEDLALCAVSYVRMFVFIYMYKKYMRLGKSSNKFMKWFQLLNLPLIYISVVIHEFIISLISFCHSQIIVAHMQTNVFAEIWRSVLLLKLIDCFIYF